MKMVVAWTDDRKRESSRISFYTLNVVDVVSLIHEADGCVIQQLFSSLPPDCHDYSHCARCICLCVYYAILYYLRIQQTIKSKYAKSKQLQLQYWYGTQYMRMIPVLFTFISRRHQHCPRCQHPERFISFCAEIYRQTDGQTDRQMTEKILSRQELS